MMSDKNESNHVPDHVYLDKEGGLRTDLKALLQSEEGQKTLRDMEELREKLTRRDDKS